MARIKNPNDTSWNEKGQARFDFWVSKRSPADIELTRRINRYCIDNHPTSKAAGLRSLVEIALEKEGY